MSRELIFALLSGAMFGIWPLIARSAKITDGILVLSLSITAMIIGIVKVMNDTTIANLKNYWFMPIAIALAAGTVNGFGSLFYAKVINSGKDISSIIPIAAVAMPLFTVFGGILFYQESLTINKTVGVIFAIIAIYFLNR